MSKERKDLLAWAVVRWDAEVRYRPINNIHRRALDDTWRQVIRQLGGDPARLCGPDHDTLVANADKSEFASLVTMYDELLITNAQLQKDAARYQWLRDSSRISEDLCGQLVVGQAEGEDLMWGEQLDHAIDTAMTQEPEE